MGLDVLEPDVLRGGERSQRAHLVLDVCLGLGGAARQIPPAEAHQVRKARVRADGHARRLRQRHGPVHHQRVPGVVAAGYVHRGDVPDHLAVKADGVRAKALAKVAVQIYLIHDL